MASSRMRVLLLFGGRSAEHDVSRVSAVSIAKALDPDRYEVIPVGITTDGEWLLAGKALATLASGDGQFPGEFEAAGTPVSLVANGTEPSLRFDDGRAHLRIDVAFPILHGPFGEDGTIQGLLEVAGLPYVGAGVLASALTMDKIAMKRALAACGLPQVAYREFRDGGDRDAFCERVKAELGLPCFVKPANMGSSVGVSKAHDKAQLAAAIEFALEYDEWVLVEEFVEAREIEISIIGDDPAVASIAGELISAAEFYRYEDKYCDGQTVTKIPAELSESELEQVRELAIAAFHACRGEALARVDFFYEVTGPCRGWLVNELNSMPGFTPFSLYPQLWEASGLSYPELVDRLVGLAVERHRRRNLRSGTQRPDRPR